MKVIVAKHIGFCSGVRRALELADKSLKNDPKPVYFLGGIIHNEKVIGETKRKGGRFISDPKQAKSGTLLIRAHGFPPFKSPKGVLTKDLTCPLVKRVQTNARILSDKGYRIIIIGDRKHPEVRGIKGYVDGDTLIIENEAQARKLKKLGRIGVVIQTTKNIDRVNNILKILEKKAKELKWVNTICPEVLSRQKELSQILKKVDAVLIIGSHSSSNTKSLVGIAKKSKKPSYWINSTKELAGKKLGKFSSIGIVSGASTPDEVINKIVSRLKEKKQK